MQTVLHPYLIFDGNAREAMEFYQQVLGGKLSLQTFGEAPMPAPSPDYADKIVHAHLDADGLTIMASDNAPGAAVRPGDNVHLSLVGSEAERLTLVFDRLSERGKVTMKLEKQFWGDTFGSVTDRYGVGWMVNITKAG
jgi:PhnB protein